jgi:hypothetical protein
MGNSHGRPTAGPLSKPILHPRALTNTERAPGFKWHTHASFPQSRATASECPPRNAAFGPSFAPLKGRNMMAQTEGAGYRRSRTSSLNVGADGRWMKLGAECASTTSRKAFVSPWFEGDVDPVVVEAVQRSAENRRSTGFQVLDISETVRSGWRRRSRG